VLGPLAWLGAVETCSLANGHDAFCLTSAGALALGVEGASAPLDLDEATSNEGALVVQPNFDVIVYDPANRPELMYQIGRFAERVSVDRLALFRLTRDSLCDGLQLGVDVEDVVQLLGRVSRTAIPQNVEVSLRDWARQFESIRWTRNACVLEAPDRETLDGWLDDPEVGSRISRRLSATMALVDGARLTPVVDALIAAGAGPRLADATDPLKVHAYARGVDTMAIDPADANLYVRASLGRFAEPTVETDGRTLYRLTRDSVRAAIASGFTIDQIGSTIDQIFGGAAPPGLKVRVKGWTGGYRPMRLGRIAVLTVPDSQTLRELRQDPEIVKLLALTVSATAVLVRMDDWPALAAVLDARGIPVEIDDTAPLIVRDDG
jgi:hypothetical protein